jgi:hypothetical protein
MRNYLYETVGRTTIKQPALLPQEVQTASLYQLSQLVQSSEHAAEQGIGNPDELEALRELYTHKLFQQNGVCGENVIPAPTVIAPPRPVTFLPSYAPRYVPPVVSSPLPVPQLSNLAYSTIGAGNKFGGGVGMCVCLGLFLRLTCLRCRNSTAGVQQFRAIGCNQ